MFEDILHLWVLYSCHEITDASYRDVLMERLESSGLVSSLGNILLSASFAGTQNLD